MKARLFMTAFCILLVQTLAAAPKPAKGKPQDRTGQVIYQDPEPADLARTKILKVNS